MPRREGTRLFAYVIDCTGRFEKQSRRHAMRLIGDRHLVFFGDGDSVTVAATEETSVRFLLISGKPIGESIAWRGPIVVNTDEELEVAFDELDRGTFIKVKGAKR